MNEISKDNQCLMEGIQNGSLEAFEKFYTQNYAFVYSLAYKILQDTQASEDVCHDVFIEISQKAHTYSKERGSIEAWLAVRTRSRSIDYIRKKREVLSNDIEREKENSRDERTSPVDEKVMENMDRQLVLSALKQLPEPQAKAIYGNYYESIPHKELASKLKQPLGTVKSLIRYGVKNLRKQLEQAKGLNFFKGDDHHGV
ncbi:sigma-70 family RNA polymerase sigma factor [Bacillus carboniphilus]|uniref:Sigma-70 family RNA polymerase sigma factor n=1 Tax=Bacillus carboniphilus TaxID=86663 RepID=A0ABN0W635_9BACI